MSNRGIASFSHTFYSKCCLTGFIEFKERRFAISNSDLDIVRLTFMYGFKNIKGHILRKGGHVSPCEIKKGIRQKQSSSLWPENAIC